MQALLQQFKLSVQKVLFLLALGVDGFWLPLKVYTCTVRTVRCVLLFSRGRAWRFILLIGLVGAAGCLFQSVTLGHAQLAARWTETRAGGN